MINNHNGDSVASSAGINQGKIRIALYNITGKNTAAGAFADQIIRGEEALKEYQKISQNYKLEEVFALLDSFRTPEEIFTAAEKIEEYLGK